MEGSWTSLKRMYYGVYRYISFKHLQRYCDEMNFRYNSKDLDDCRRFDLAIRTTNRARIKYRELIGKSGLAA
ncbi:transposase [Mucilaginibacter robiniae]|uniref:Transposase n=1 Tax=Mucilaginibacter robiniae TaxID=2728022 RepID=A0A7L5E5F8_9SPHI|nr:transposase [Mucilaginibacter robiniae]